MSLPPLSYSFIRDYDNCPRKAHHKYVLKDLPKGETTPESDLGNKVHKEIETQVKAGRAPLGLAAPPGGKLKAEWMLGIDRSGTWQDFFKAPWLRGKVDLTVLNEERTHAALIDWKTGKVREDPDELHIQAVLLKGNVPDLKVIRGAYYWFKEKRLGPQYDLADTDRTLERIRATELKMQDGQWDPTPNPLCGWCPVKRCQYNRS